MKAGALVAAGALVFLWAHCAHAQYQQCPANTVLAGPASGPAASPTCRVLGLSDVPTPPVTDPFNVKLLGAKGDGTTDDTKAIQAALNSLPTGGALYFPQSTYCIKTGPLTITHWPLTLFGDNREASILSACGTDSSIIVDNGFHTEYFRLRFDGSQVPGTTKDVLTIAPTGLPGFLNQTETTVEDCYVTHGHIGIKSSSVEVYIKWSKIVAQYGPASVQLQSASTFASGYIFRNKMDQPWPVPPSAVTVPVPIAAWVASHAYATGAMASTGSYILQATAGGTSGTSQPAVPIYNTPVTDGTVTWQLAKPNPYYGVWCDTGCGALGYIFYNDFSSTYDDPVYLSNTLSGSNPFGVFIEDNTFGAFLQNGILADHGEHVHMRDNYFGGCVGNPCTNISLIGAVQGDNSIEGGGMVNGTTGIFVGAGSGTLIRGQMISAVTTAISIAAGIGNVNITGNKLGGSAVFGGNGNGVFIAAGASDYIKIPVDNDFSGASTPINDNRAAQGAHDNIVYDVHGLSCAGTPTSSFATSGGVVTHC